MFCSCWAKPVTAVRAKVQLRPTSSKNLNISLSLEINCLSLSRVFEPVLHKRSPWLRLASTGVGPILRGGQAYEALERSADMALFGEASGASDLHERLVRRSDVLTRTIVPPL